MAKSSIRKDLTRSLCKEETGTGLGFCKLGNPDWFVFGDGEGWRNRAFSGLDTAASGRFA
jgi:hypothetical protein